MPNIVNETEDDIDYEMDDGRPDDDNRKIIHQETIGAKGSISIDENKIPVEIINHRFISRKSGDLLGAVSGVPREHNATLGFRCEVKPPQ